MCCNSWDSFPLAPINYLPNEVLLQGVFPYLHPVEIWRCRRVCKTWLHLVTMYFKMLKTLELNDNLSEYYFNKTGLNAVISSLRLLRVANLNRCHRNLTQTTLSTLATNCVYLEMLSVVCCKGMTDLVLKDLAGNCHGLKELVLTQCFQV